MKKRVYVVTVSVEMPMVVAAYDETDAKIVAARYCREEMDNHKWVPDFLVDELTEKSGVPAGWHRALPWEDENDFEGQEKTVDQWLAQRKKDDADKQRAAAENAKQTLFEFKR